MNKTTKTDSDGCYQFLNMKNGTYEIKDKDCPGGGKRIVKIANGSKRNNINLACQ
ncbi:MAG: hypothetical protein U0586_16300 [Candidatus Brocadiaceae bacterium]